MNEQLIVKNFGPIKDATVDFKRVTVFIGPTGGGKSTLAKLAAILRKGQINKEGFFDANLSFADVSMENYIQPDTNIDWTNSKGVGINIGNPETMNFDNLLQPQTHGYNIPNNEFNDFIINKSEVDIEKVKADISSKLQKGGIVDIDDSDLEKTIISVKNELEKKVVDLFYKKNIFPLETYYIPSERIFVAAIRKSWAGFINNDIGLPKTLSSFANIYFQAREIINILRISFLGIDFFRDNEQDLIVTNELFPLKISETASGIQSTTPMLVVLEYLSRQKEITHSFIVEEPELNLYPTAQQGLMNWLVEKCTKGENDLTITTHSPYILSHINLLLYAYQVVENHPDRADDVAKVVPRESWINPKEFACYHVEGQKENGIYSIVNPETGLISYNMLDAIAGAESSEFEKLLDINAGLEVE
ncbi:AAA family ATPase [Hymenobacter aerilatus]|uniref:AAA family ATPase n=1 Tax=Hymenobacter aerilatus TaxID=2932251 RepID=A0A8T9SWB5_9BACT|nr:AAA family ATPase [Hymenobacter aerilatus]UOR05254.1 AAA family ATPase [Hymenobacter aerilatus]